MRTSPSHRQDPDAEEEHPARLSDAVLAQIGYLVDQRNRAKSRCYAIGLSWGMIDSFIETS